MASQNFFQTVTQWLNQIGEDLSHTAIIWTIIGVFVVCIQLGSAILKQRREDKVSRAKFGYDLIDAIFANPLVNKLLEYIDSSPSNIIDVGRALDSSFSNLTEELQAIRNGLDWLLLYFDRLEHALSADLTNFEAIRMPLGYYVALLAKVKKALLHYTEHIGYDRVVHFLDRFESWRFQV
jgi:hypothetical protein